MVVMTILTNIDEWVPTNKSWVRSDLSLDVGRGLTLMFSLSRSQPQFFVTELICSALHGAVHKVPHSRHTRHT